MKVLILAMGNDTAGQGYRIKAGFDRHSRDIHVDAMHASDTYARYPAHLRFRPFDARKMYHLADVVHLRNHLIGWEQFDEGEGKPIVLHHHGTHFRRNHATLFPYARSVGATQMVSTLDLETLEPGLTWLPAPYNLDELAAIRRANYRPDGIIRIVHAPTNRQVKGTRHVLHAIRQLVRERAPIKFQLVERRSWAECLALKGQADIFIDQMTLGYGNNAVEAWGMGLPVLSGIALPKVEARMRELWGGLPFYKTSEHGLLADLRRMIASPEMRQEWGAVGLEHVRRFHDERKVVAQLADIYRDAQPTRLANAA